MSAVHQAVQKSERRRDDPRVGQLIDDLAAVKGDVCALTAGMEALSAEVAANTQLTEEVKINTAGLVQILNESEQAFRLFNRAMDGLRWFIRRAVLPFAVLAGSVWAITHDGRPPEWLKSWVDLFR